MKKGDIGLSIIIRIEIISKDYSQDVEMYGRFPPFPAVPLYHHSRATRAPRVSKLRDSDFSAKVEL